MGVVASRREKQLEEDTCQEEQGGVLGKEIKVVEEWTLGEAALIRDTEHLLLYVQSSLLWPPAAAAATALHRVIACCITDTVLWHSPAKPEALLVGAD